MKKFAFLAGFAIITHMAFAQCPLMVTLKTTGHCLGDTLTVSADSSLSRIVWYNGAAVDTTVNEKDLGYTGVTVAGRDGSGSDPDHFDSPYGIYVDAFGNVYVADSFNGRIQEWAPGASSGVTVAGGQGLGPGPNQLSAPLGVFIDKNGYLYVTDAGNSRVQKSLPGIAGGTTVAGGNGQGSAANQLITPFGVFVDGNDNLYVADAGNNRVQKFPPGSLSTTDGVTVAGLANGLPGSGPGQLNDPLGIFLDGSGNLYIADYGNSRVQKWTPGAVSGVTVAGGNGKGSAGNQISCPTSVFVDRNNNLFVTDACNNRVQEWSPGADSGITVAGGNGEGPGADQLRAPYGVFVDANGALYVSDYGNSRVQKIVHEFNIDTIYVPTEPGDYKAVATGGMGCGANTGTVVINPKIFSAVSIGSSATVVCADSPVTFNAVASNGGAVPSFQWLVNGNKVGPDSPIFTDDSLSDGDKVSTMLTSDISCTSPVQSNSVAIVVRPRPSVYAGRDTVIAPGRTVQLGPSISGIITSYQWSPATGLDNPSVPNPIAAPTVSTAYQLTVVGEDGCSASGKINILVYYSLRMPEAFTPNGDGKNDLFRVPPSTPQKIINFSVYNRNGSRVFMTRNGSEGWNGNFNGQPQPPDAYVWEIEYFDLLTGKPLKAAGTVVLVR
jgi:gliding motility-associated-like protein